MINAENAKEIAKKRRGGLIYGSLKGIIILI